MKYPIVSWGPDGQTRKAVCFLWTGELNRGFVVRSFETLAEAEQFGRQLTEAIEQSSKAADAKEAERQQAIRESRS